MSFKALIFFGIAVLLISSFSVTYAQPAGNDPVLEWYESFFLKKEGRVEDALRHAEAQLEEAVQTRDPKAEIRIRKEIGLLHLTRTHDYEKAMGYFIQCLFIEDSLDLKHDRLFTHLAIAQVFEVAGDLYKSAESLNHALAINDQLRDAATLMFVLNKLGKINAAIGHIDEAFENFQTALHHKDEVNTPRYEAEALLNLAHLYTLQGNYQEALETHKRSLSIRRRVRDKKNEALSLNDIGELYRLMKNDEKALANHVVALEIRQALGDKKDIAESYNNIGILYFQQQNFERAVANFRLALEAAQDAQAQEQIRRSYDYLSQCYRHAGDYKKALEYKDLFVAINDFIQNEKNEQRLLETQNRYTIDRKQSQIEKLDAIRAQREKELQAQKQFRDFLVALIALTIVVALLTLYLYIVKRRSNKTLQVVNAKVQQQNLALQDLNATKDKFFSIISHDLKGPLNSLTSFSSLLINHTDSLSKDEIRMLAKDLDKSLKNLFALLENLLEWSRSQTGNIEFKFEPFNLAALLQQNKELLLAQARNKKIAIETTHDAALVVSAHRHSVNTVVRNLISNAIKFTPENGCITLSMALKENEVVVSVADTGVGMPAEVLQKLFRIDTKHTTKGTADEKGTGLGLILCKDFVEKNGGRIWVESTVGKGSVFSFTLPYAAELQSALQHQNA
jgi:signal transduction histidine kinase